MMTQFTSIEISNWIAIYVAAGMCCAIAMALSVSVLGIRLYRERAWLDLTTLKGAALFLPKIWWRWQKLYLTSTPVTLGVVSSFGASLAWT